MTQTNNLYDVVVIGGGPAGLTAGLYLARARYRVLILEKDDFGGQITITNEVVNYPGVGRTTGRALTQTMRQQAQDFGAEFLSAEATGLDVDGDIKTVHTSRGDLKTFGILIATGASPRKLGFEGEAEYAGRGVAYCATCDAEMFKGKEIYVLGAGDQAIEEADYLTGFASKVTVIVLHEEGHLDCNEVAAATAFRNPKIDFVWNSTLEEIKGRDEVEGLVIKNVVTGASSEVETDGIFFFVGMIPQTELVRDLVECDDKGYIAVNEKKETSVPGIYAVGDCTQTFLRQVVTAAADGAIAATASERYVKEKKQIDSLLTPDAGKVAFVFYDPYDSEQIEQVSALEEKLRGEWRVERQDITRQSLLYGRLGLTASPATAFYFGGKLMGTEV